MRAAVAALAVVAAFALGLVLSSHGDDAPAREPRAVVQQVPFSSH